MSREDDRSLRFYNEVLGLDHLHYGLWEGNEALTLANLKIAQLRYEDFLISKLPSEAKKIPDLGCGTSAMTKRMLSMNIEVHGLSPDEIQKKITQNLNVPFYQCFFENFDSEETLDLARLLAERILRGMEIYSEKPREKHPFLTRILFRLFRKKWEKINWDRVLILNNKRSRLDPSGSV